MQQQLNINEIAREQVIASTLAERDATILAMANTQVELQKEIEKLKEELKKEEK